MTVERGRCQLRRAIQGALCQHGRRVIKLIEGWQRQRRRRQQRWLIGAFAPGGRHGGGELVEHALCEHIGHRHVACALHVATE